MNAYLTKEIRSLHTDCVDMKSPLTATFLPLLAVAIAMTTSCASAPWLSSLGQAPVRVTVANGCPADLGGAQDVVNSYTGDELVPPGPVSALICRYWSSFPATPETKSAGRSTRASHLPPVMPSAWPPSSTRSARQRPRAPTTAPQAWARLRSSHSRTPAAPTSTSGSATADVRTSRQRTDRRL